MPELNIQGLLEQLAAAGVDYIVIGGVAVGFHGYVRATKDLDVVPAPSRQNLERLAGLLRSLKAELDGAADSKRAGCPIPSTPRLSRRAAIGFCRRNWAAST